MNYPMYGNNQFYMQDLQNMKDRIDKQMQQMQQIQQMQQNQYQTQQPVPQVTQNFQLAPNPTNNELESRYANNIDEVKGIFVMKTGVFLNKELNTLWLKNTNGDIRTFQLNEIIEQDPRDEEIQMLRDELEKMKGMINKNESNVNNSITNGQLENKNATKLSTRKQSNVK